MAKRAFIATMLAALALPASAAMAAKPDPAPAKFWGMNWAFSPTIPSSDLQTMQAAGLKTMRWTLHWAGVEASEGQFKWGQVDTIVGELASHGIRSTPTVLTSPYWATGRTLLGKPLDGQTRLTPPITSGKAESSWMEFLQLAAERYGRGGAYWRDVYPSDYPGAKPLPITTWQIWNEPNEPGSWQPMAPSAKSYAELVRISHQALTAVDPHAKLALAGLSGRAKLSGQRFLAKLYGLHLKHTFDIVAMHPYGSGVQEVKRSIDTFRAVMAKHHDASKPAWLSEFSWGSGKPDGHFNKGRKGQATYLDRTFRMLARHRVRWHLKFTSWFDWRDPADHNVACSWCTYAGLFDSKDRPKPAFDVFRRYLEGKAP